MDMADDMKMRRPRIRHLWFISAILLICMSGDAAAVDQGIRTVRAIIVGDQNFARQTNWERKAREVIEQADSNITAILGVRLEIAGYRLWRHSDETDLFRLAEMMIDSVSRDSADILIGFTYSARPPKTITVRNDGVTVPLAGTMLRLYQGTSDQNMFAPYVLLHELGHLLGGVHVNGRTIMSPIHDRLISTNLDSLNRQILRITRGIDFARGYATLPHPQLEALAGLYERAINGGNHESVTLKGLSDIYIALGDYDRAAGACRRMAAYDPRSGAVWDRLGEIYALDGHADTAITLLETAVGNVDRQGPVFRRLANLCFMVGDRDAFTRYADLAAKFGAPVDSTMRKNLRRDTLPSIEKRP
jgi:tetratricopeptide (TPR) repeat protein